MRTYSDDVDDVTGQFLAVFEQVSGRQLVHPTDAPANSVPCSR